MYKRQVSVAATSQLGGLSAIVVVAMASLVFPIAWMAAIDVYKRQVQGDICAVDYPINVAGNSHGRCITYGYLLGHELAGA